MRKLVLFIAVLALTMSFLSGCRSSRNSGYSSGGGGYVSGGSGAR